MKRLSSKNATDGFSLLLRRLKNFVRTFVLRESAFCSGFCDGFLVGFLEVCIGCRVDKRVGFGFQGGQLADVPYSQVAIIGGCAHEPWRAGYTTAGIS